jgi:hypothetical protein
MSRDAIHHEATHGGEVWYPHRQGVLRSSAEVILKCAFPDIFKEFDHRITKFQPSQKSCPLPSTALGLAELNKRIYHLSGG